MTNRGYSILELLAGVVVIILIIAGGIYVFSKNPQHPISQSSLNSSKQSSSSATTPYGVLSPATVPSKTAECQEAISYASNGVPGPVLCNSGQLNSTDWDALAALEPQVFSLGYNASSSQVQSALCADVSANISNPIEETVYQIAALYYGWSFSSNPSAVLSNGTCQNVDD